MHAPLRIRAPVVAALLAAACAGVAPAPIVESRAYGKVEGALVRLAVAPFSSSLEGEGLAVVERFVTEELASRGVDVVPAQELRIALSSAAQPDPAGQTVELARLAQRKFGATGLLRGEVTRFRERSGRQRGSGSPASVAFRLSLHAAPGGKRLWTGSFDETQVAITEAPGRARRYPDRGTRWLSAHELARWGAAAAAADLTSAR